VGTVRSRLHNAKRHLETLLAHDGERRVAADETASSVSQRSGMKPDLTE
jgi:hypothetical protein